MHLGYPLLGSVFLLKIFTLYWPSLSNFAPLTSLALLSAALLERRSVLMLALLLLGLFDVAMNLKMGVEPFSSWTFVAVGFYAVMAGVGRLFLRPGVFSPGLLLVTTGLASLGFYVMANTFAFWGNPGYAQTWAGWWQSQTLGLPGYPPSLFFLRNSLIADMSLVCVFLAARAWSEVPRKVSVPSKG
jgi:hypothetical protein